MDAIIAGATSAPVLRTGAKRLCKTSVQKPALVAARSKQPESFAGRRFHEVVIAVDVVVAPPAGFDALRPPALGDDVILSVPLKSQRRPAGNDRHRRERRGARGEKRGARDEVSGAWCVVR